MQASIDKRAGAHLASAEKFAPTVTSVADAAVADLKLLSQDFCFAESLLCGLDNSSHLH